MSKSETLSLQKQSRFSFKTKEGSVHLLALFLTIIFVFGFLGQLFQSDFGNVKIEHLSIDVRGAQLSIELYYPRGSNSVTTAKLPAVVIGHGGGCNNYQLKGIAAELARRGFVVINTTVYGSGLSEMPYYDENGNGEKGLNVRTTPLGMLDAVNFARNLAFVDTTRVGIIGHSMGSTRTAATINKDCGYFSFNDIMINVLSTTFGQKFTQDEINTNADTLAKARLNPDQLTYYNYLREENKKSFDSKIKAYIALGGGVVAVANSPAKVKVGGYEVTRSVQTNMAFMSGEFDNVWSAVTDKTVKASWYSTADLKFQTWYDVNNITASNKTVGTLFGTSVANDKNLAAAADNRSLRLLYISPKDTHSQETFSPAMSTAITKYFEQTLGYNRGNLSSASTVPLDAKSNIWPWRTVCNSISLFAMLGMLMALCSLLLKTETFRICVIETPESVRPIFSKKRYIAIGIATIALGFCAIYAVLGPSGLVTSLMFTPTDLFPITSISFMTFCMLCIMAAGTLILLAFHVYFNKKATGKTGLKAVNIGIGFKNAMKSIAVAFILLIAAYSSLSFVDYFFGQDFRVWLTAFSLMKADYWWVAFRYMVIFFPLYLVISAGVNYPVRSDIPEWQDTILCVVINSLGIWLCAGISYALVYFGGYNGSFFVNFFIAWQVNLCVPITVYIMRKTYKLTNSIWIGAALCAIIVAWTLLAGTGMGSAYIKQTWIGNFLNY